MFVEWVNEWEIKPHHWENAKAQKWKHWLSLQPSLSWSLTGRTTWPELLSLCLSIRKNKKVRHLEAPPLTPCGGSTIIWLQQKSPVSATVVAVTFRVPEFILFSLYNNHIFSFIWAHDVQGERKSTLSAKCVRVMCDLPLWWRSIFSCWQEWKCDDWNQADI